MTTCARSRAELLNVFIRTSQNVDLWVIPLAKVSIDVDFMKGCIKGSNMAIGTPLNPHPLSENAHDRAQVNKGA